MHEHLESLYPDTSRNQEIENILKFVKDGLSVQMIAMPGCGRGNLCKFLVYNHNIRVRHLGDQQTSYHFVFVNFAEIKNKPIFDAMKFIFLELVSSLNERKFDAFEKIDSLFKKSLTYHDELVLFEGMKDAVDILTHEYNIHTVLLFERFELYIPKLTEEFFIDLRSLRDKAKYKFSVIFSTTRPLEDTIEIDMMSDFYEFFGEHHVYLDLFDKPGIDFRIDYLEKLTHKKLEEKTINELLVLTGGHGKLTRLSAEAILAISDKREKIGNLGEFLLSQKTIQKTLKEIWDFLTPNEQVRIMTHELRVMNGNDDFLEKVGLVRNNSITVPLFKTWIEEKASNTTKEKETIVYDQQTNTIKKGEIILSDTLTASEYRLLRFILENPEKVLERDDIISSVWKDTATTIGVTEQALDQLIFRLRRKIESNPNNPEHIITVKGRGLKYIP